MSLLSENVIPKNQEKILSINAKEFTYHTNKLVSVKDIENAIISLDFRAIPKDILNFRQQH